MYGYNAGPPMAIPIYTVLPYCVIKLTVWYMKTKMYSSFSVTMQLSVEQVTAKLILA